MEQSFPDKFTQLLAIHACECQVRGKQVNMYTSNEQ